MEIKVKRGRHKGQTFKLLGEIGRVLGSRCLPELSWKGNWPARAALDIDRYTKADAPLYFGRIGKFEYIISHLDLYGVKLKKMVGKSRVELE